jgi:hypothetical protein
MELRRRCRARARTVVDERSDGAASTGTPRSATVSTASTCQLLQRRPGNRFRPPVQLSICQRATPGVVLDVDAQSSISAPR